MAAPTTWTDLATVLRQQYRAALSSESFMVTQVQHPDGSSVTYRDLDQLRRALGQAEMLAQTETTGGRTLFLGVVPN